MSQHASENESSDKSSLVVPSGRNWLEVVKQQVTGLKFGAVTITVHEGRVVQIETSVKLRFDRSP